MPLWYDEKIACHWKYGRYNGEIRRSALTWLELLSGQAISGTLPQNLSDIPLILGARAVQPQLGYLS
jgi:hypothetical protein